MRVLSVHNSYDQAVSGEDVVREQEACLLESRGHEVERFSVSNADLDVGSVASKVRVAAETVWSGRARTAFEARLTASQPDLVHVHNTFPVLSPSIYGAARANGIPLVQTLHNYRLVCADALLLRDEKPCEDCLGRSIPLPAAMRGCYRGSRLQSTVVASMLTFHNLRRTWSREVDMFIAVSDFVKDAYVRGGFDENRIIVKPNFVQPDAGVGSHSGDYALFVGRLSVAKGVPVLLEAWKRLAASGVNIRLKIVGDGALRQEVEAAASGLEAVEYLGPKPQEEVLRLMQDARILVFPSIWYETFGLSIAEAFSCGLPVVASDLGVMREAIRDGETGLLFEPNDSDALAQTVRRAWSSSCLASIGANARREFEVKYTAEANYKQLMTIYERAMAERRGVKSAR